MRYFIHARVVPMQFTIVHTLFTHAIRYIRLLPKMN